MKVKVTSTGITQKGTSSHMLNARYHVPNATTITRDTAPCITIPRIPNAATSGGVGSFPRPFGMNVLMTASSDAKRQDGQLETKDLGRGRECIGLLLDAKPGQGLTFTSSNINIPSTVSTLHYTSATPSSSLTAQNANSKIVQNTKSKPVPVTQAIRIAVQPKKVPVKLESSPIVIPQRKPVGTAAKKDPPPATTTTAAIKEVKQVFVKHTPPPKSRTVTVKQPQSQKPLIPNSKKTVPPPPTEASKSPSKGTTGAKRKSDTPAASSTLPKSTKYSNKGKGKRDLIQVTPEHEVQVADGKCTPTASLAGDATPPSAKKKKRIKSWKTTTTAKQSSSLILFYGSTAGFTEDSAGNKKKVEMPFTKADHVWLNEMAASPVASEIKDLLHAFGDSSEPLTGTVQIMEEVLFHEMAGFIRICEQKAAIRGTKTLGIIEAVLALKRNIPRMDRLYKHFGFKDIYDRKILRLTRPLEKASAKKQLITKEIQRIIKDLNLVDLFHLLSIGLDEIENSLQGIEDSKLEEAVRSSPEMLKFYQYAKTRSLSFARKLSTVNTRKAIVTNCHIFAKMTDTFGSVLDFFILDFVSELTDSAFGIRKERLVECMDARVANPDTCMSAPFFLDQKKAGECRWPETVVSKPVAILYPSYIREAYMRLQMDMRRPALSFPTQAGLNPTFI